MTRIAIIEDDKSVNETLRELLAVLPAAEVQQAFDLPTATRLLDSEVFDLVVVDIELGPGPRDKYGGLDILAGLRGKPTVTIVVSGMPEENLPNVAISLRAYDFISKPINNLDFMNKVEHALAWPREAENIVGPRQWPKYLEPDASRDLGVRWRGKPVPLSLTQLRLVHCLSSQPGKVVEYSKLAKQLVSSNSPNAVTTHLSDVRRKFRLIDPSFDWIDSEPGKGYVWKTED